jgi:hypothetical protein
VPTDSPDLTVLPELHVLFTLDVPMAAANAKPYGPQGWDVSARSVDAFCTAVINAGFAPTIFLTPEAAAQHGPMCEELSAGGADVGLLVHPPTLRGAGLKHLLGAYPRETQVAIVAEARGRWADAIGHRPTSARSAWYSATNETFDVLSAAGFQQASLSSPGRRVPKHHAHWDGAAPEVHYASSSNRLEPGELPLLEVPVTTDPSQRRDGIAPDLAVENGTLDRWHAPLIEAQLTRQDTAPSVLRTLCFVTSSGHAYHDTSARPRQTLDALLDFLGTLEERYILTPATLAATHAHYRAKLQQGAALEASAS